MDKKEDRVTGLGKATERENTEEILAEEPNLFKRSV